MKIIPKLSGWFSAYAILIFAVFILLIIAGNAIGASSLTYAHPFWGNVFFVNYTVFGNGFFALCLAAIFLFYFKKRQKGYSLLLAVVVSFLFTQLLKNVFSGGAAALHFEANQYLFLQDAGLASNTSTVISGYTVLAFSIATIMVFYSRHRLSYFVFLPMAVLVAYSRMYLAQNSLLEVLLSSLVGLIAGTVALHLVFYGRSFSKSFAKMHRVKNQPKSNGAGVINPA